MIVSESFHILNQSQMLCIRESIVHWLKVRSVLSEIMQYSHEMRIDVNESQNWEQTNHFVIGQTFVAVPVIITFSLDRKTHYIYYYMLFLDIYACFSIFPDVSRCFFARKSDHTSYQIILVD
jgi:hypothetical protein